MSTDARNHYVCPACRSDVTRRADTYDCSGCARTYPVLFDIPDFRLAPDPYLSLEEERSKAARLHAYGQTHSFDELVAEYYRITADVPAAMAQKYAAYVRSGIARGKTALRRLDLTNNGSLLDAGCGAGGLVIAAAREGRQVCGLDIALRWLVIAAKRLEEQGLEAELVCANIETPPFPAARFTHVIATDLFEHVTDTGQTISALHELTKPGGALRATGSNRFTLATHPVAGLWGIGYLPGGLRTSYVKARRGLDTLRHANLITPGSLARDLRKRGYVKVSLAPIEVDRTLGQELSGLRKHILPIYNTVRNWPIARQILVGMGPAFEVSAVKP